MTTRILIKQFGSIAEATEFFDKIRTYTKATLIVQSNTVEYEDFSPSLKDPFLLNLILG